MNVARKKKEMLTIRVPGEDWAVLLETLTMDSRSGTFDPALRRRIRDALKQVRKPGEPYVLTVVCSGVPEEAVVFWDEQEALRAAKHAVKDLREDYDVLSLTRGGEVYYSWPKD